MQIPHADIRLSRRDALKVAVASPLALWLSSVTGQNIEAAQEETRRRFLPLILLYLNGGASAKEMWDPDPPGTPAEFRGELRSIPTRITGYHFAEPWPEMARHADQLAIVRSINTGSHSHDTASQNVIIGNSTQTLAYRWGQRSAAGGVPYAAITTPQGRLSSLIGNGHQLSNALQIQWEPAPRRKGGPLPPPERGQYLPPPLDAPPDLAARATLLQQVDTAPLRGPVVDAMMRNRATALSLLLGGGEFDRAFHPTRGIDRKRLDADTRLALKRDIERFDRDIERYGNNPTGRSLLLARRLVEQGTGSVTIHHGDPHSLHSGTPYDWDDHWNVAANMRRRAPPVDRAVGALLEDLRRNRFEAVLAIVTEFSRTPRINNNAGRDHWSDAMTIVLAGGPHVRGGVVVGRTHHDGSVRDGELRAVDGAVVHTVIHACGGEQVLAPTDVRARGALQ